MHVVVRDDGFPAEAVVLPPGGDAGSGDQQEVDPLLKIPCVNGDDVVARQRECLVDERKDQRDGAGNGARRGLFCIFQNLSPPFTLPCRQQE